MKAKNRTIKFRIWDNEEQRMIIDNGYSLHCYDNWCINAFDGKVVDYLESMGNEVGFLQDEEPGYYVDKKRKKTKDNPLGWKRINENRYVPLQFTGLLDSKKKEIYEGDILLLDKGKEYESYYEVIYGDAGFYLISAKREGDEYGTYSKQLPYTLHENPIIVGNIYENKELLK